VVVLSVPFRGARALADANLRSAAIGLSDWLSDSAGVPFRRLLGPAQFYVPSDTRYVRLPVRLEAASTIPVVLEIRLDGKLANRIPVEGRDWTMIGLPLPEDYVERRFRPIQIALVEPGGRRISEGSVWLAAPRLLRAGE
jgi:hypothetical protein